jgi:hypothetical protein
MEKVKDKIFDLDRTLHIKGAIFCPRFGSDLAVGNWDVIKEMILEIWCDAGIDVTVCIYP